MQKIQKTETPEPVFKPSAITLSAEETRLIVRVANNTGKPLCDYRLGALTELGLLKPMTQPPPDHTDEIARCWERIRTAAKQEDLRGVRHNLDVIENLKAQKGKEGYVLTDLGKQVARGIAVRLNGQYAKPGSC